MKKKIGGIVICLSASFVLILTLHFYSLHRLNKKGQNILRNYFPAIKTPENSVDLENSDYYFAGNTGSFIYLGNYHFKTKF